MRPRRFPVQLPREKPERPTQSALRQCQELFAASAACARRLQLQNAPHAATGQRAAHSNAASRFGTSLDYVTELTKDKKVNPDTFAGMSCYYSEREICEIVWLVASERIYTVTNTGLNIHSDMLCDISRKKK